jgi:mono/diheme cytochrome c family protein
MWQFAPGVFMHSIYKVAAVLVALPVVVFSQTASLTMTAAGRIIGPNSFPQREGAALYQAICQGCHMDDARGGSGAGSYPALAADPKVGAAEFVIYRVLYGRGGMPAFDTSLDDQQVAALATYVRTNFGNHYPQKVRPDQVKALREGSRS